MNIGLHAVGTFTAQKLQILTTAS